jgi:aminopeptidase N
MREHERREGFLAAVHFEIHGSEYKSLFSTRRSRLDLLSGIRDPGSGIRDPEAVTGKQQLKTKSWKLGAGSWKLSRGHMISRFFRPIVLVVLTSTPAFAQRLPDNVVPTHYDIAITPNLPAATFTGTERIAVTLKKPSSAIVLNAAEIEFDKVVIKSAETTQPARVSLDAAKEQATLTVDRDVPAGVAEISIEYRGVLNDQLRGLYLSKANNRRYAVTQLEATDARRMFPSFDEPAYKATFSLTATIDQGDHAISNGAVVSDTPGPGAGKHTVKFDVTPKMSTYLVALAVGDFECQSGSADSVPIRICSTPDKKGQTGFALEAAEAILRYYNKYYAVKYPFKKLDVVAVPDFAAGAMENTAAIFYRETLLLADPNAASISARKQIGVVLAHEMAHQWFGDLVTMRWWDDIWLNEGFANWMETKPLKSWKPDWHMELSEVRSNQDAMRLDSLKTTRPIRAEAWTPAEISELFDAIAYEKGAAVLRMVEAWVGEEPFRAGINAYIERFQYGNARAEDFWGTLTKVTGKPVDKVMAGFVDRPGVPVVDPQVHCETNRGSVTIAQEAEANTKTAARASDFWTIPVCVKTSTQPSACTVVAAAPATVRGDSCPTWVMANAGGRGYYRVVYSPEMIRSLARAVDALAPTERIALLSDEWALVRARRHEVGTFMDLAEGFKNERTPDVLETLLDRLSAIGEVLTTDASRAKYRAWVAGLLKPAMNDVGWTPRSGENEPPRDLLVSALGRTARDPETIQTARRMVLAHLDSSDSESVDSTLLNALVGVAAIGGDASLYDRYLARSKQARDPEEHYRYLYALADFSDPTLVRRTMDLIVGPEVRSQDTAVFLARLFSNSDAAPLAWEFLQARWGDLEKKAGQVFGSPLLISSLGQFCDTKTRAEIETFFATHKVPEAERTLQQALERISSCAELAAAQSPKLAEWLQRH